MLLNTLPETLNNRMLITNLAVGAASKLKSLCQERLHTESSSAGQQEVKAHFASDVRQEVVGGADLPSESWPFETF